jgi:hypothetical protein
MEVKMNKLVNGSFEIFAGIGEILISMPTSLFPPSRTGNDVRNRYKEVIAGSALPNRIKKRLIEGVKLKGNKESLQSDVRALFGDCVQLGRDMRKAEQAYVNGK